jgi:hypothetical protein
MFLGARVDDALSTHHRHLLEHGEQLTLDQLQDAYRDHWTRELAAEQAQRGVLWDAELDEQRAFTIGLEALALTLRELVPRLGRPVAVQRELSYALAPGLPLLSWVGVRTSFACWGLMSLTCRRRRGG